VVTPASGENGDIRRAVNNRELPETFFPASATDAGVLTLYQGFQRGLAISGDRHCMGFQPVTGQKQGKDAKDEPAKNPDGSPKMVPEYGEFRWMTYKTINDLVSQIGSSIANLDLAPANDLGDRPIGLYSKNRWEWQVAQQGMYTQSVVSVPLYDTLGEQAVTYIVRQTGMATIFCGPKEADNILSFKTKDAPSFERLRNVIQFDDVDEAKRKKFADKGLTLRSFNELVANGKESPKAARPPLPADKALICYTSGTTGDPKGAILTHRNMVADASNAF